MNRNEREYLAVQATSRIAAIANTVGFESFGEKLHHKFLMVLCSIDQISLATTSPLLITNLIAGIDVLVLRSHDAQAATKPVLEFDNRALISGDDLQIEMIGEACAQIIPVNAEGALMFHSDDGTVYMVFRSRLRHGVLQSVGISTLDSIDLTESTTVLQ